MIGLKIHSDKMCAKVSSTHAKNHHKCDGEDDRVSGSIKNFITECCMHDHGDQPKGNRVIAQNINILALYLALRDHRDDREDYE